MAINLLILLKLTDIWRTTLLKTDTKQVDNLNSLLGNLDTTVRELLLAENLLLRNHYFFPCSHYLLGDISLIITRNFNGTLVLDLYIMITCFFKVSHIHCTLPKSSFYLLNKIIFIENLFHSRLEILCWTQ